MDLTLARCFVQVHDPDLALAFYRDALGLELRNDVARGDSRWITLGSGSQPGVEIPTIIGCSRVPEPRLIAFQRRLLGCTATSSKTTKLGSSPS